jgi:hypothetical protein
MAIPYFAAKAISWAIFQHVNIVKGKGDKMDSDRLLEDELLGLIEDIKRIHLRAEARIMAAERDRDECVRKLSALNVTLELYRAKHGMTLTDRNILSPEEVKLYTGLDISAMVIQWSNTHGGLIAVNEAAHALSGAGLFSDPDQARGTLYPTLRRMTREFVKVSKGTYRSQMASLQPKNSTERHPLRLIDAESPEEHAV